MQHRHKHKHKHKRKTESEEKTFQKKNRLKITRNDPSTTVFVKSRDWEKELVILSYAFHSVFIIPSR